MDKLIQALIKARKRLNLSQTDLGRKLGLPQSHISKIEKGDVNIRLSSLVDMARLLGLEVVLVPKELVSIVNSLTAPASGEKEEKSLPEMLLSENSEAENTEELE